MSSNQTEPRNGGTTDNWTERTEARRRQVERTPIYDGVDVDEKPDELTIRISGPSLANIRELQRIVDEANGTDSTARDFVWGFLLDMDQWRYLGAKVAPDFAQTAAEFAATAFDDETERELMRRFRAAGFTVG